MQLHAWWVILNIKLRIMQRQQGWPAFVCFNISIKQIILSLGYCSTNWIYFVNWRYHMITWQHSVQFCFTWKGPCRICYQNIECHYVIASLQSVSTVDVTAFVYTIVTFKDFSCLIRRHLFHTQRKFRNSWTLYHSYNSISAFGIQLLYIFIAIFRIASIMIIQRVHIIQMCSGITRGGVLNGEL